MTPLRHERRRAVHRALALLVTVLLVGGLLAPRATAQGADSASAYVVRVVTFGQGHEVFERFGHNALWISDSRAGRDVAYHWGLFDFNEPDFLVRFLTGDTRYSMGPADPRLLIEHERNAGRPVTIQTLDLTPDQARTLADFVRWNALEENRYYRYDYYRDNCSTRLRDALDRAVGGAIRRATDSARTALSYRRESVRLTDGAAQAGIDVALGRPADEPLSAWQSFFIPMRLRDALREIQVSDADGHLHPIVFREQLVMPPDGRLAVTELTEAPRLAPRFAIVGVVLAALVVVLRIMAVTRRGAAWGLAVLGAGWSLVCGLLGIVLLLAWFFTRHVFWGMNATTLLLSPVSLLLVVLIPLSILRNRARLATARISIAVAILGCLAAVVTMLPNGPESRAVVALLLPTHLALAWALRRGTSVAAPRVPRRLDIV
ncbi:MAG: DUF4105 domain-containing protein [Gemmatimonadaceae bacterium]|nr:DUF4105 domain-containing protein [Gemmatimonadaceae bacterium]